VSKTLGILLQLAPNLVALFTSVPDERRRAVAQEIAMLAATETGLVDEPAFQLAASELSEGGLPRDTAALQRLVDQLDELAMDLDALAERTGDDRYLARYEAAFSKARAGAALLALSNERSSDGPARSLYESYYALGLDRGAARIENVIRKALDE
jgi:hypothetical protein